MGLFARRDSKTKDSKAKKPKGWDGEYAAHMATIVAECPPEADVLKWCFGHFAAVPFQSGTPAFEAAESRSAEADDIRETGWNHRRDRFVRAHSLLMGTPKAITVLLPLGEQLYDAGALDGPYGEGVDEADVRRDGLRLYDPGPRRLAPLITLAISAGRIHHPRAVEWRAATDAAAGTLRDRPIGDDVQQLIDELFREPKTITLTVPSPHDLKHHFRASSLEPYYWPRYYDVVGAMLDDQGIGPDAVLAVSSADDLVVVHREGLTVCSTAGRSGKTAQVGPYYPLSAMSHVAATMPQLKNYAIEGLDASGRRLFEFKWGGERDERDRVFHVISSLHPQPD